MKKVIALFLLLAAVLPLSSCKSTHEEEYERQKAVLEDYEAAAEKAKNEYEQFKKDMSEYQSLLDRLNNYER